jgi:hypothetical protein
MSKAQRAHQSQSVPMGTGFRPLPSLPEKFNPDAQVCPIQENVP